MAGKPTVKALKQKVADLLALRADYERYQALEKEIKSDMARLKYREVDLGELGRVFISESERVSVSPAVAINVLGEALADKVIVVTQSVSNELVAVFVKVGLISKQQREELLEQAEKTPVTRLYVRPLK